MTDESVTPALMGEISLEEVGKEMILRMNPMPLTELGDIKRNVSQFRQVADSMVIRNEIDLVEAGKFLTKMSRGSRELESVRKGWTKPVNDIKMRIHNAYMEHEDEMEAIQGIVKGKIQDYDTTHPMEIAVGEYKGAVVISNTIDTEYGSVTFGTERHARVVDFAELPDEFKMANDKKLEDAAKSGIAKVPGVEFYEEPTINTRLKPRRA